jgi:predicted Fe-Mo cluster-binding NifX family protein
MDKKSAAGPGYRLAFASTDRLTVHSHFGHAWKYEIVEIDSASGIFRFVDSREVEPPCRLGGHSEAAFDTVLQTLSDCDGVVVAKIGYGAAEYVMSRDFRIFEAPGVIENIVASLLCKKLL